MTIAVCICSANNLGIVKPHSKETSFLHFDTIFSYKELPICAISSFLTEFYWKIKYLSVFNPYVGDKNK